MIQTIRKAWGIPELRKKIVFTLLILLIFRVGNAIPTPYINTELLGAYIDSTGGSLLSLYNVMSGGAFAQATVFALGVQPYINSSIIIQLLTIAIPALERLAREGGEAGKKKIASITRYATVAIDLLQAFGYYMICKNYGILEQSGIWPALVIIVTLVAGSSFVMWLGEQVNEFGIGNGISMILFAGILARIPTAFTTGRYFVAQKGSIGYLWLALVLLGILAMIVLIVHVNGAERRIPVQYAKRQVGRKMYGGQASTLPMKVNMSGVLPIIFAQSIASLPATVWVQVEVPDSPHLIERFTALFDSHQMNIAELVSRTQPGDENAIPTLFIQITAHSPASQDASNIEQAFKALCTELHAQGSISVVDYSQHEQDGVE